MCVSQLHTDSSPAVLRSGHQGVNSDILSNCIILLSMLTADVIFHRSVLIIRARFSQRGPTWCLRPFAIGLGIFFHTSPAFCTPELFKRKKKKERYSYISLLMKMEDISFDKSAWSADRFAKASRSTCWETNQNIKTWPLCSSELYSLFYTIVLVLLQAASMF